MWLGIKWNSGGKIRKSVPTGVLSMLGSWESAVHQAGRCLMSDLLGLYLEKGLGVQKCCTRDFNLFDP